MTQPDPEYRARQEAQQRRYLAWVKQQPDAVGHELPTRLTTLFLPEQKLRMEWLKTNAYGTVLEVGCNFGAVLAYVGGDVGVDINPLNIEMARLLSPDRMFETGNAVNLRYFDNSYDTVMLPEILEHLSWPTDVKQALHEASRVATTLVLVTMPDGSEHAHSPEATSFKHQFLADQEHVEELMKWFPNNSKVRVTRNFGFVLIRAVLRK